ncbi:helix-turn-helix domain-containing protein [Pseudomonas syringae group genomosp. 7]|uniref:helix-turn-helix domain-containing protein n=1 Tax=Pseudomonas syringae group genomosp. 7 TaxID=251699 RepID=UPI0006D6026E|nr:helix-turn-helix domain-containing protein [Pseudomonas syringae group genomosp. 7]RMR08199.1 hypothetical protein ALP93_03621 [Pseudomonas syringae pv. helianthi]UNB61302.1 helix-turn-helix domain-containing protein [Pseudomonas syringae pv. helianthi]
MTDLNLFQDLPDQFVDPTAGFNRVQMMFWQALESSHGVPIKELLSDTTYKAVLAMYAEHTGQGQSQSRDKFLALKRAEQEFYRACATEHAGRYRASQQTVDDAVLLVIDAEGNTAPRAALLDAGVPAEEVARIAGKNGSRRKVKKSLQKHAQHPNAQRMIQTTGKREYMRMGADTLSGSLEGIAVNMKTHALLTELKANAVEQARQIAELQAWKAAVEIRHAVEDSGVDVKAEAVRMRADGMSLGAIAQALGKNKSAIQRWTA